MHTTTPLLKNWWIQLIMLGRTQLSQVLWNFENCLQMVTYDRGVFSENILKMCLHVAAINVNKIHQNWRSSKTECPFWKILLSYKIYKKDNNKTMHICHVQYLNFECCFCSIIVTTRYQMQRLWFLKQNKQYEPQTLQLQY
jgi:hypothetical protein